VSRSLAPDEAAGREFWRQGVQVTHVREGDGGQTLFLICGPAGSFDELAGLASALTGPQGVIVLAAPTPVEQPSAGDRGELTGLMVEAVRQIQPSGPYLLSGLSSGTFLAVEIAESLTAAGENVAALFLIEAEQYGRRWSNAVQTLAAARYRPPYFDGTVTVIAPQARLLRDPAAKWFGRARHVQVERIDAAADTSVARIIDHQLARRRDDWAGLVPQPGFERPMILTTMRWFGAARLAHALTEAGFAVSACRPSNHPLDIIDGLTSDCRLRRVAPLRSLAAAIRRAQPDIILPEDERALVLVRRLYARIEGRDPQMAALLARSLGDRDQWSAITSRTGLVREANELGVPAPATAVVATRQELTTWVGQHGLPVALKTDGSWGGRGVAIVPDSAALDAVWPVISRPPSLVRAVKRLVVNRELQPLLSVLRSTTPVVNAQAYVAGRDGIATASCLRGEVLQIVCLEVVQASVERGPATVVRIIDHPQMADTVRSLVRRFGLSGFCGFDFVIAPDGRAMVIEVNPRVTPTCFLLVEGDYRSNRRVALFPFEMVRSGASSPVGDDFDVPVRAPQLVQRGLRIAAREQRMLAARRLVRVVTGAFSR
jgi:thioesterase domain-containing protein